MPNVSEATYIQVVRETMPRGKVSIILPALNEEQTIGQVIDEIPKVPMEWKGHPVEVLVIDNGSTDRTAEIAVDKGAQVIYEPTRGKGMAMRTGFKSATGEYIFMLDADFTYPATYVAPMLELLELGWEVVLGSRIKGYREKGAMSRMNLFGNHVLALVANVLYGTRISDVCSGSWGFKRHVIEHLELDATGFELEANMFIEVARRGYRIGEIPIYYRKRPSKAKLNSLRDGMRIGRTLAGKRVR